MSVKYKTQSRQKNQPTTKISDEKFWQRNLARQKLAKHRLGEQKTKISQEKLANENQLTKISRTQNPGQEMLSQEV
jgi:hypothetical protein